jgi:hypothetical protein
MLFVADHIITSSSARQGERDRQRERERERERHLRWVRDGRNLNPKP